MFGFEGMVGVCVDVFGVGVFGGRIIVGDGDVG